MSFSVAQKYLQLLIHLFCHRPHPNPLPRCGRGSYFCNANFTLKLISAAPAARLSHTPADGNRANTRLAICAATTSHMQYKNTMLSTSAIMRAYVATPSKVAESMNNGKNAT